jgi:hypothetical protein
MTSQDLIAELENLRREQLARRKHWLRCGFVSNVIGLLLCAAALIKVAITGGDPPPLMIFVALTFIFLGIVFIIAGEVDDVSLVAVPTNERARRQ